jgi:hypothetical protein
MGKFLYKTGRCRCNAVGHLWERVMEGKILFLCASCIRTDVILCYGEDPCVASTPAASSTLSKAKLSVDCLDVGTTRAINAMARLHSSNAF